MLLAESESALRGIVDVVRQNSEEKGLSMNVKKMNTMMVCRNEEPDVRILVNGQVLEQVKKSNIWVNGLQTMVDANVRLRIE